MNKKLESNIWKYTIASVANKRIFVAVIGAYYLTIPGVTPQVIGLIALCGNLASFMFEIPSGYVSDKIGHKEALIVSRVMMLLSSICFYLSDSVILLIAASVLMSIGLAFNSGTGSAFIHETLKGLGRDGEYSAIVGRISAIGFGVPIILTVLVPFLVSISYKIPFLIMSIIDVVGLIAVLSLLSPPVEQVDIEEIKASNFKSVLREARHLNFFTIAIFSGLLSSILASVAVFREPYQLSLGISVVWFGIFIGIGRALSSLMLAFSGKISKYFTFNSFYAFQYVLHLLLILSMGLFQNVHAIVIVLIINSGLKWGFSKIDEGYQLRIIGQSKFKATLLSIGSQLESVMTAGIGFLLGWAIERYSYRSAFVYISLISAVILTALYLKMVRSYRDFQIKL